MLLTAVHIDDNEVTSPTNKTDARSRSATRPPTRSKMQQLLDHSTSSDLYSIVLST